MRNINLNLEEFLEDNSIEAITDKYILDISDDDNITYLNNFIYEVLDGVIPTRNEEEDDMLDEDINIGDIVYIMADNGYPMTYDGVDNESFQGFDAFSDEEETNSEEFLEVYGEYFSAWLKEEIKYKVIDIIEEIEDRVVENNMTIYRGMSVERKKDFSKLIYSNNYTELGVCWAHEKDSADAFSYSTDKNNKIILEAKINITEVDWEATIELNLSPSLGEEEKEIRIFDNSVINLDKIIIDNEVIILDKPLIFKGGAGFYDYNTKNLIEEYTLYQNNQENNLFKILKEFGYSNLKEFEVIYKTYKDKSKYTDLLIKQSKQDNKHTLDNSTTNKLK